MNQQLQQIREALRGKAEQFDASKVRAGDSIKDSIRALRDQIKTVENELLVKVESTYNCNVFSMASAEIESSSAPQTNFDRYEEIARRPVPTFSGPTEDDFLAIKKAIFDLTTIGTSAKKETIQCPRKVEGKATSSNMIELIWEEVPKATGYQVEMRKSSEGSFHRVYEGNGLKYAATGLEPNTKYLFHVRAICGIDSTSEWSEVAEVKTPKMKKSKVSVPVPESLSAELRSLDSVNLTWKCEPQASSYRVEVTEASESLSVSSTKECGRGTSYLASGLKPGRKYSFRVQAGNQGVWGEWSREVQVKTPKWKKCTWNECPDNIDEKRKYSVDEMSPRIATKINSSGYYCTVIGNTPLPHNKVTSWNIKILKSKSNNGDSIFIGVAPSEINQNEQCNYKCGWYFLCYYPSLWSGPHHNYKNKEYGPRKEGGKYIHTGDSVGVVMDTAKGELSFVVNDVNYGVAFDGIPLDKPLVPCVLLFWQGDSVELII